MVNNIFFEIAIILYIAAVLGIIFNLFKQPPILAYILTGIIIGPLGHLTFGSQDTLALMAQFGITLLLFMLGLEVKFKELESIGTAALKIGFLQIVITSALAYVLSLMFGYSTLVATYIALALTFSSTIVVVKLLGDKKELFSLNGKLTVGMLLVQDFFAIFVLMILSSLQGDGSALTIKSFFILLVKGILLTVGVIYIGRNLFPHLIKHISKSLELLFISSLAWVFCFSSFVSSKYIGFPIEMGGFLAGIALANVSENFQIVARVKALRDFFITIFFVLLGVNMTFANVPSLLLTALLLSSFVLVGKPLIVTAIMGFLGYRKRTSFLTGLHVGQISEFSLVIIFLGSTIGHVSKEVVSLVTLVGIISFAVSTYLVMYSKSLYMMLLPILGIFERQNPLEKSDELSKEDLENLKDHVVLVGVNRMGESILEALQDENERVVVIDFNPDVIKRLKGKGVTSLFGDIADLDIHERAQLHKAKLVISTVSDSSDNLALLKNLKKVKDVKLVVVAGDSHEAKTMYKAGADYVVSPQVIGGMHLARLIKDNKLDKLKQVKEKELSGVI